ncbi:MAG: GPW/gp25 family protein [Tannerella sp.]|uniref:GPW/gp25 family protein n=1 Tax=Tannerella sp. TaxID=2382127 RepID=UPI003FA1ECD9
MDNNKGFLGRGWGFPPHFSKTQKGAKMVSDEEDIAESLRIIFSTNIGERFTHPDFGTDFSYFQFRSIDLSSLTLMKEWIEDAILSFEPRVELISVEIDTDYTDGKLLINVLYEIRATNSRYSLVFPFYINEGIIF